MHETGQKIRLGGPERARHWRGFMLNISVATLVLSLAMLSYLALRSEAQLQDQLLSRARSAFESLTLTRRWNASHGGVYVRKEARDAPNDYLNLPEITTKDGEVYRPVHPAGMTREVSSFADEHNLFTFHLSSTRPLNPANQPDLFEQEGYLAFVRGQREYFEEIVGEGRNIFRYMAPLLMEKDCLPCHHQQGYKEGDIRGAVSIRFDISSLEKARGSQLTLALGAGVLATLVFLGLVLSSARRLNRQVEQAQAALERQAHEDELTGLFNRRHFFARLGQELSRARRHGRWLSLVMMDLDHFKNVNDRHGHQAGDEVLRQVARRLAGHCRSHDVLARYGGEEMALILPETDVQGAASLAEKLRAAVEEMRVDLGQGLEVGITISLGAVSLDHAGLKTADDNLLVRLADQALYRAKQKGRNRVEQEPTPAG